MPFQGILLPHLQGKAICEPSMAVDPIGKRGHPYFGPDVFSFLVLPVFESTNNSRLGAIVTIVLGYRIRTTPMKDYSPSKIVPCVP